MRLLAQSAQPSIWDNAVLDEFVIPFGDWFKQVVFWVDLNLSRLFQWIELPFAILFNLLLEAKFTGIPWPDWWPAKIMDLRDEPYFDLGIGLQELPWYLIVAGFFVLALFLRNVNVAVFVAVALTICGLLGIDFWQETTKTIGMILVAVVLCAIIGIPLGVACGRIDGLWSVTRPALDAMQVVHPFVYMLPAIFFFGIGEVSSTMVSMVFALPPIVRLTNLGIRQVPEDVVEASRAFGASERKVLFDVQLPLARTAIMTGLNQTLLLAFSMLGIAALMSAGGLGKLLLLALNNAKAELAASSGLAFFLVAVVLDRMSQPEGSDSSFGTRLAAAWMNRRTPELLLPGETAIEEEETDEDVMVALTGRERLGLPVAAVGAVVSLVSLVLTWSTGAAISSHSRRSDLALDGSYNGLDATGGSWFGYVIVLCGFIALLAAVNTFLRPGRGARLFSPDIGLVVSGALFGSALGFIIVNPSAEATVTKGIGPWIALVGSLLALAGFAWSAIDAPYGPHKPLPGGVQWGRVMGCGVALLLLVLASTTYWSVDTRGGTVLTPEIEAQIQALKDEAGDDLTKAAANAQTISNLVNSARVSDLVRNNGFTSDGPGLAPPALALGALGLLLALPGAGLFGKEEEYEKRFFNALVGVCGFAIMAMSIAWIGSLARATDPGYVSGLGSFIALCCGFIIFASGRPVLSQFFRKKVHLITGASVTADQVQAAADDSEERELVGVDGGVNA